MSFSELGLSPKVLEAVEASGYTTPTPIQEGAIPSVLARRDVLGLAQTGTGKTASFTLPMLTLLEQGRARARMPRTLILEPTRELAAQVEQNFVRYGKNHKLSVALLIGGVSFGDQDAKLTRGVDVLIATPGRLLDHFERGRLLLTGIEILVIDEADRMLDMGFIPDIERICSLIPSKHQTLFFSATMPSEIQRLTDTFLRDPVRVEVAKPATTSATVTQQLVSTTREPADKRDTLRRMINAADSADSFKNAIIFCNRKTEVAVLHRSLVKHGFNAAALHGDMDQRARMAALDGFRNGEVKLLIASDVAARGLDIPDVSHVFNFDVPIHADDYVHRIGRTGRAGRSGIAVTLVAPSDAKYLGAIEKLIGKSIDWIEGKPPAPANDENEGAPKSRSRSRRGGSKSKARPADEGAESREAKSPARAAPADEAFEQERAPRRSSAPRREASRPVENRPRAPDHGGRAGRPGGNRPQRHYHDDEPSPVGLGEHVPSFLLRPVRIGKSA
jgi:superfamily II DNA/RNA helicase